MQQSAVIESATYLLTINSPDIVNVAMSLYDITLGSEAESILKHSLVSFKLFFALPPSTTPLSLPSHPPSPLSTLSFREVGGNVHPGVRQSAAVATVSAPCLSAQANLIPVITQSGRVYLLPDSIIYA